MSSYIFGAERNVWYCFRPLFPLVSLISLISHLSDLFGRSGRSDPSVLYCLWFYVLEKSVRAKDRYSHFWLVPQPLFKTWTPFQCPFQDSVMDPRTDCFAGCIVVSTFLLFVLLSVPNNVCTLFCVATMLLLPCCVATMLLSCCVATMLCCSHVVMLKCCHVILI